MAARQKREKDRTVDVVSKPATMNTSAFALISPSFIPIKTVDKQIATEII